MKPEQKFYQRVARELRGCDVTRVENTLGSGMPDVNVCLQGREVWLELKCFVEGRVLIRPPQNAWGNRRAFFGGRVHIIAEHPSRNIWWASFPLVQVTPHGKYLSVTNMRPLDISLYNFLFPQ